MRATPVLIALCLAGCAPLGGAGPSAPVRYTVGAPYQALGVWRYPHERFVADETGLAAITGAHGPRATDDEPFDQTALAAAHPDLQLPALARITNLESGRQILVRVNDRGPVPADRAIALTRRAAELIGARDGTQLRVQVMETESRQLASELRGEDGKLAVAIAPKEAVRSETLPPPPGVSETLPPPPGVSQGRARVTVRPAMMRQAGPPAVAPPIPLRLPEQVFQVSPRPGSLYVVAGSFGRPGYADILRRRLGNFGARTVVVTDVPGERAYRVEIGPIDGVAAADAMLGRVLGAGVSDARIVVQ